jgi:FkbM family methyltransferase
MINALVKSALARMGVDIKRLSPLSNVALQVTEILRRNEFDLVFDVGANLGQFGEELRHLGFQGEVVSFEPLSAAYGPLCAKADKDSQWSVHERCALGAASGVTQIHIAGNLASSSVLPMNDAHRNAAPISKYTGVESVRIETLDAVAGPYLQSSRKPFLKIDTQGYELEVLRGAEQTLNQICGLLLEMSLVELYDGQVLWLDLMQWLKDRGFELWMVNQGFVEPNNLRTLQVDGIFLRRDAANDRAR